MKLKYLETLMKGKIPFEIVRNNQNLGNIIEDYKAQEGRYALIPTHIKRGRNNRVCRRTCTYEYKIKPIQVKVREMLGVKTLRNR